MAYRMILDNEKNDLFILRKIKKKGKKKRRNFIYLFIKMLKLEGVNPKWQKQ